MKKLILISALLFSFNGWAECISGNCVNGEGTYVWSYNAQYKGNFKDGKRHGYGEYTIGASSYIGTWENGQKHGYGVWTKITKGGPNRGADKIIKYEGFFQNDKRHGKGKETYSGQYPRLKTKIGYWENNEFIGDTQKIASSEIDSSSLKRTSNTRSQARTDAINALMGGFVGAGGFLLIIFIILGVLYFYWNLSKKIAIKAKPKIESTAYSAGVKTKKIFSKITKSETEQLLDINDKYFEIALDEIESNSQRQGLWIKLGALAEGNTEKQKALYIKHRAKQLSEEE